MNGDGTAHRALRDCRIALYHWLARRADALFELADALLASGATASPAHLRRQPVHRRGWGSLSAALAGDASVWARCDAETRPERGWYYHASRHSSGQPVVPGWSYQWINQLGFARDSWTAPLDVRRMRLDEDANTAAALQIKRLLPRLPTAAIPLFVFDAGYDPLQLALDLGEAPVATLVRLRAGRCFYADPDPATRTATGRPRRHGRKFACKDPATWPTPTAGQVADDAQYGMVRVRAWAGLHTIPQNHATKGSRGPKPLVRGTLVLVEVGHLPRGGPRQHALWLWWRGPGTPDLDLLWRAYVRRFDQEHTFRFVKQVLNWTAPRVRHPEQADRRVPPGCWLVVAAYTQLRLARACVQDQRLPWERALPPHALTPARVRRAFSVLQATLGTPASAPKPAGRSPGRPPGRRSPPAPLHPARKRAA
jgi:hypothetical protein